MNQTETTTHYGPLGHEGRNPKTDTFQYQVIIHCRPPVAPVDCGTQETDQIIAACEP